MDFGRWRPLAAAMTLMTVAAVSASADTPYCVVDTTLHWVDVGDLAPFAYDTAASEVRDVLAGQGVCADLEAVEPSAVRGTDTIGVILLRSMGPAGAGHRVLGAVRRGAPRMASVWIYFDEVASVLGLRAREPHTWTALERSLFGRALGRVAAHEVIHSLLPDRPHDGAGLMAASLGHEELTGPILAADPSLPADLRRLGPAGRASNRSWRAAR